jgi:hypothetical protein
MSAFDPKRTSEPSGVRYNLGVVGKLGREDQIYLQQAAMNF